ncbi:LysE family translocator [Kineosporia succinea]
MDVLSAVASFALVAGLLTIVPGLDTALVLRSAAVHGRAHAFMTALGINTGALIWGAAAAGGATALLTTSETAYTALRIAGAAYVMWMGGGLLLSLVRRSPTGTSPCGTSPEGISAAGTSAGEASGARKSGAGPVDVDAPGTQNRPEVPSRRARSASGGVTLGVSFRRGLMTNLLNPKVGVFYMAMLPQFVPDGVPHLPMGVLLAAVHDVEGMLWFTVLIFGVERAGVLLRRVRLSRRGALRVLDGVTGSVLVGFGAELALSDR